MDLKQITKEKIKGIYALVDTSFSPHLSHIKLASELLKGGVKILQLRIKDEKDLEKIKKIAQEILKLKNDYDFTFILNDHLELALELNADGVHLGKDDLSLSEALISSKDKLLIGYSSHSYEEALEAEAQGAHYVALGAIYPTKTKGPGHPVVGIKTLEKCVQALKVPLVAIGGINRSDFKEVNNTGVAAIAMITALTQASDVAKEAAYFVSLAQS